jgi:hypothetical protein
MAKHGAFNGSAILGIAVLSILAVAAVATGQTTQPAPPKPGALAATPTPTPTPNPNCPTRAQASADYQAGMTAAQVMAQFPNCHWPIPTPWTPLPAAEEWNPNYPVPNPPMKWIDNNGNVFWEGFDSCGYHPQNGVFSCVLEVRQTNQYWGFPEWVKFCIDYSDGLGFTPVDLGSVRVINEPFNQAPIWYFAVNGVDDARLAALPLNGRTYVARAALSWLFPPVSCNAPFFWGNTITFRIRLD